MSGILAKMSLFSSLITTGLVSVPRRSLPGCLTRHVMHKVRCVQVVKTTRKGVRGCLSTCHHRCLPPVMSAGMIFALTI